MRILVDGDIIVYSGGFASDKRYYVYTNGKGEKLEWLLKKNVPEKYKDLVELEIRPEPLAFCLQGVKNSLEHIVSEVSDEFGVSHSTVEVYLTGKGNYREDVAVTLPYKGNRVDAKKPTHYNEIKEYLKREWDAETIDGMEADDKLGIEQCKDADELTVIVSIDKDLLMIPGEHYNNRTGKFTTVSALDGDRNFFEQMLKGDRVDNIEGLPGIGDVKARKMLSGYNTVMDMYLIVYNAYEKEYGYTANVRLLENEQLLWILRKEPDYIKEDLKELN